ncbi:YczE/YyaS/YitT family protein [Geosporobacter ferrireducens]|uniref:YitT family protein n=1 Tax=Geosporobacter ferrireducens TaxID=1424294 RepID=A0A1D8GME0_9FIRM|nr:hypothetical protein [Geosporobacter ferrireducens]AOT72093.1 hypothetical protein Gferi_22660 [Geosporobacter ferrireducens]MTI55977.1 hypothetical protein [Geosporobacter ferrireducens]
MKAVIYRIFRLFIGLIFYAVGIVMTINANLGLAPWDVFHQGLSKTMNISMGQASIGVGLMLIISNSFLGERLGWGTICNMFFIGFFMDILMFNHLIPIFDNWILQLMMLLLGMFLIGIASIFYIGASLGAGPRDGLMIALTKKTGKSVRFIRNSIELSVLSLGYILGGFIGVGTLITALAIGYIVQFTFKLFHFEVNKIQHRFIDDDIKFLGRMISKKEDHSEVE